MYSTAFWQSFLGPGDSCGLDGPSRLQGTLYSVVNQESLVDPTHGVNRYLSKKLQTILPEQLQKQLFPFIYPAPAIDLSTRNLD